VGHRWSSRQRLTAIAEQLSALLSGLDTQRTQLDGSLKSLAKLLTTASDSLPQVEAKIVQLTEQVTFGVKQNQDEMTKTVRDSAVALQATVADLKTLLLETLQSTNRQIGDHMKQLAEKTNEQMVKLDLALETELSKSISSLGRQLTALSGRFVEDYAPLTEKLRMIVQGTRGA
jgi:ABC-type transporter Mla subunit MlaD